MKILIKKLHKDAIIPKYMTKGAVAFDVCSIDYYTIRNVVTMVKTGIAVAIPDGYEINVRARSGLSLQYPNYFSISGGGTIDSDYRGEIIVPVINRTEDEWEICPGDRIAQCIVAPISQCDIEVVNELPKTERGEGGFGHTGR